MFDTLNNLEASISAIRAYNYLITTAVEQGDNFSSVGGGLHVLLETQVDALQASYDGIREEFQRMEKDSLQSSINLIPNSDATIATVVGGNFYRENQITIARLHAEGRTIDEIAALTDLARDRVRIFIKTMPDHVKEAASKESPAEMRSSFIAERIRDGYDASEIAQALNLKRATVERVIGRLLGSATEQPDAMQARR